MEGVFTGVVVVLFLLWAWIYIKPQFKVDVVWEEDEDLVRAKKARQANKSSQTNQKACKSCDKTSSWGFLDTIDVCDIFD